jgi:[ribosomal protein S5]-alanine N-acetyltransferase
MEFLPLTTPRLLLRKVEPGDASFVLKALSNDAVTQFMLIRYYTQEEVQIQMDYYAQQYANKTGCYWLMQLHETAESIGVIGFHNVSMLHCKAEIGFWLTPEHWSKGYVTEAGKALLHYCFEHQDLNRIEATVETANLASIKAIEKLGMQHEGTFRQYEINNGRFIDLMMYAILKQDFH